MCLTQILDILILVECWSGLWSRGQGWFRSTVRGGREHGDRGRDQVVGSAVVARDWWLRHSLWGERESPPACHSLTTSNMPYYVDLWRWLGSTFNWVRPGPSKDLSLHKIKGGQGVCQTKANSEGQPRSWTRRFTLRQPSECRTVSLRHLSYIWQLVNSVGSEQADAHIMAVHHLINDPLIWFDCRCLYLCSV